MKLVAAVAALPAAILADAASEIQSFCNIETTDPVACEMLMNSDAVAEAVGFCMGKDADEKITCMTAILNEDDDDGFATGEYAMDEFLNGIGEDPMLQNVLAELNGLQAYLEANGVTRSAQNNPEGLVDQDGQPIELPQLGDEAVVQAMDSASMMRRFVELKQLVSWMQPKDKRISRYCFYGCWCLPEGAHSFVAGEGRPVDLVDKACQYLWFCYTCAKREFSVPVGSKFKECIPDRQKYTFRFKYNKAKPADYNARDIICKDTWYKNMNTLQKWRSSCSRAICECDRGLAMRLYRAWKHWDKSRHRIWSQKVIKCKQLDDCDLLPNSTPAEIAEKASCVKRGCLFIVKHRCLNGDSGGNGPEHNPTCCGLYTDDGGRMEMRSHGGTHECCSHEFRLTGETAGMRWMGNWFNIIEKDCVDGVVVEPEG